MAPQFELNETLIGALSLRAIKSFLAAAKFNSFTGAAHALSVTPAAVSKQVRELEDYLGTALFVRSGRAVTLTADGEMFKDAAQLSLINIHQAAERLRKRIPSRQTLIVCCSPTFSALWLHKRLPEFIQDNPDIELTVLATQNFIAMEAGVRPDVYIAKLASIRDGYDSEHLFDDEVYPVCTPHYLQNHGPIETPEDLLGLSLLDISAYGRSQISEHIDWKVWLALHDVDTSWSADIPRQLFTSNDYPGIVQLALAHQGVVLGWHHLVGPLVESGDLVRPLPHTTVMKDRGHYLSVRKDKVDAGVCKKFCQWIKQQLALHPTRPLPLK
ncbi:transcriptional regulator, LysR family [Pseudogulbenkiania sp. NH8B]|uniref:LysR substrate-binding domain-containing protein n=1 Tax=Pseudogulbenkiania sp. (strain NH8B) TaxID=748280 RepID=UPI0002279952|nr:LysR substrate-binding domain-containing protein [Pseudogulbenkiania sp. NH8B]BAK77330.1 transcriptional regulator, LysR family [Pseudogulbenkiania sp. NH8B]